jgi:Sulfotransferase domain
MVARARARVHGARVARIASAARRSVRSPALPNVVVIGGLKCGTTSLHHYLNLHPEVQMSRPKELNFFVAELNWNLGHDWYASHFRADAPVRGESSPHYTNRPRFEGVAERMASTVAGTRIVYMVRDPIDRMLSHYLHNLGSGYDERPIEQALGDPHTAYVDRSRYFFQLEPFLEAFEPDRIMLVSREELLSERASTMRRVFGFLGVDEGFSSEQFGREWETGTGKGSGSFRIMDRAVRLPGLRALDRNYDRLPEALRWRVERLVHDPDSGAAPKPELPTGLRTHLVELLRPDTERLERFAERSFGWLH